MPYVYDPYNNRYVYYAQGTTPPKFDRSGKEQIPGYANAYEETFPNQPYSRRNSSNGSSGGSRRRSGNPDEVTVNVDDPDYQARGSDSPGGSSSSSSADQNAQTNAYEYLRRVFEGYGLGSLASKILEMVQKGYDPDTIALMLQDTPEYKQRFKANEMRRAKGISVLSPAEYIALERQYRQLMATAGLPAGFYDSNDDFTSWIAGDVSPAEVQDRVAMASQSLYSADPYFVQQLRSYGLGDGELTAYFLDAKRALPLLQKAFKSAQIGAEASRNSLGLTQARAEMFADLGVTQDQARSAYQAIGEVLPTAQKLGGIYGESFGQSDLEDEILGGSGLASQKRKRLAGREISTFSGGSGVTNKSLGGRSRGEY